MILVFATNNKSKIAEVKKLISAPVVIRTLEDVGCTEDLPETGSTLEQNAIQKAQYIHDKYGSDCFADDSGLEVEAIGGRPGVYSARYAGPGNDSSENIKKLLAELKREENRKARFKTVIALIVAGKVTVFEGSIPGEITLLERGTNGFGYDPVFVPEGFHITFAEMNPALKNKISHRAIAVQKLCDYLKANF